MRAQGRSAAAVFVAVAFVACAACASEDGARPATADAGGAVPCGGLDQKPSLTLGVGETPFREIIDGQDFAVTVGPQGLPMLIVSVRVSGLDSRTAEGLAQASYDGALQATTPIRSSYWTCVEPGGAQASDLLLVLPDRPEDVKGKIAQIDAHIADAEGVQIAAQIHVMMDLN